MLEDNINSFIDVTTHPRVNIWLNNLAQRQPLYFSALARDNTKYLSRYWGLPEKNSNSEWKYCWYITANGIEFKILTGRQGTVFLCRTITTEQDFKNDPTLGLAVIRFLEETMKNLCGI